MSKKKHKVKESDWSKYEEDNKELFSYIKKKGKHQRVEKKSQDR